MTQSAKIIGIYGGTFNPVHNGHVRAALAFYDRMKLDLLYIIPNFSPPHKSDSTDILPEHRLEMARLAFEEAADRNIIVSDMEIKRGGMSYTYNTVERIYELYSSLERLYFLVGTDMYLTLDQWRNPDYLFSKCCFVLLPREKNDLKKQAVQEKAQFYLNKYSHSMIFIDVEPFEVSSTEIRSLRSNGNDIKELVPKKVWKFIETFCLYS